MSEIVRLRTLSEIEDEAAAWVWRLDSKNVSGADRQAFEAWIKRDPRHRPAFEELGGVWRQLDALSEAKREEKIATFADAPLRQRGRRSSMHRWSLAAGVAAIAIGVATLVWYHRGNETQAIATAVGQQRSLTLADGSVVQINTNSMLETKFDSGSRAVFLGKGEAHFTVAPDAQRPFIVHAGGAVVRALGTEFDVRIHDNRSIEVIVAAGRVGVLSDSNDGARVRGAAAADPSRPVQQHELAAGERLVAVNGAATVNAIDAEDVSRTLAWRQGAVVFAGEPLSRALAELNRYTETRFVVTDREVGELRIGGRFKTTDVEGIVRGLESALPIATRRTDDGLIFIERRR